MNHLESYTTSAIQTLGYSQVPPCRCREYGWNNYLPMEWFPNWTTSNITVIPHHIDKPDPNEYVHEPPTYCESSDKLY